MSGGETVQAIGPQKQKEKKDKDEKTKIHYAIALQALKSPESICYSELNSVKQTPLVIQVNQRGGQDVSA